MNEKYISHVKLKDALLKLKIFLKDFFQNKS